MGEIDLDRPIVDPQLVGGPGQQRHHVGRIGHPVAVLDPLAVLGDPAGGAQGRLADQGRRAGRPLLLAAPQRRGRQRQRRERFAARLVLRLGRRRRAAIDRPGVAFVGPGRAWAGRGRRIAAAHGRRQPKPLKKLPPRESVPTRSVDRLHGWSPSRCRHMQPPLMRHCLESEGRVKRNRHYRVIAYPSAMHDAGIVLPIDHPLRSK